MELLASLFLIALGIGAAIADGRPERERMKNTEAWVALSLDPFWREMGDEDDGYNDRPAYRLTLKF